MINKNIKYTLGVDMGLGNISFCLLNTKKEFIKLYQMQFDGGYESKVKDSKNIARRNNRGQRRGYARRRQLLCRLRTCLISASMYNKSYFEDSTIDVIKLRVDALSTQLSLFQIGRVFYQIAKHRAFQTLRKSTTPQKESKFFDEIKKIEEKHPNATPGQIMQLLGKRKNIRFTRQNIKNEAQQIIDFQSQFYPQLKQFAWGSDSIQKETSTQKPVKRDYTKPLLSQFGILGTIFFQRHVYWDKSTIGKCSLEKNKDRCHKSDPLFEEFRLRHEINNLSIIYNLKKYQISNNEKDALYKVLAVRKNGATAKQLPAILAKVFNIDKNAIQLKNENKIDGLKSTIFIEAIIGNSYDTQKIAEAILYTHSDEHASNQLRGYKIPTDEIEKLLTISFTEDRANLSRKALNKLLIHMRKWCEFYKPNTPHLCAQTLCGYSTKLIRSEALDSLPSLAVKNHGDDVVQEILDYLGTITNVGVKRALRELRVGINEIIRVHGKPMQINIETTRELISSKKAVSINKKQKINQKRNEDAKKEAIQLGLKPTKQTILLIKLWLEQKTICPYSSKQISASDILCGKVEIDHILPLSLYGDDSYSNKVLCFSTENQSKGQRTVPLWLKNNPDKLQKVLSNTQKYNKNHKASILTPTNDFTAGQLSDTSYICQAAKQYLELLVEPTDTVNTVKGIQVAKLRQFWGLPALINNDKNKLVKPQNYKWCNNTRATSITNKYIQKNVELNPTLVKYIIDTTITKDPTLSDSEIINTNKEIFKQQIEIYKKNRFDHRHHCIDAFLVSILNHKMITDINKNIQNKFVNNKFTQTLNIPQPVNIIKLLKEELETIIISHKPHKKSRGKLHEATTFAKRNEKWTKRINAISIKENDFDCIVDEQIKNALKNKKVKFMDDHILFNNKIIKRLRIFVNKNPEKVGNEFFIYGNIHRMDVYKNEKGKPQIAFISNIGAKKETNYPEFLESYYKGEMISFTKNGETKICVITSGDKSGGCIMSRLHNDASTNKNIKIGIKDLTNGNCKKLNISRLGII